MTDYLDKQRDVQLRKLAVECAGGALSGGSAKDAAVRMLQILEAHEQLARNAGLTLCEAAHDETDRDLVKAGRDLDEVDDDEYASVYDEVEAGLVAARLVLGMPGTIDGNDPVAGPPTTKRKEKKAAASA